MVAKCANPECNCEFRELSKGRLFLLPPSHDESPSTWRVKRLTDHCYWLCPKCATALLIRRGESGVVVIPRDPMPRPEPAPPHRKCRLSPDRITKSLETG
jgi:hypothetical protein